MSETTFIYALVCPDTEEVRYVGKANNPESRFRQHCYDPQMSEKTKWIKSLADNGKKPHLLILEEVPMPDWLEAEKKWIKHYRSIGKNLFNAEDSDGHSKPQVGGLVSIGVTIPDELNEKLNIQAELNHRSKNKHIIHLLESAIRAAAHPRYQLGIPQMCHNGLHLFAAGEVTTKDFCNCGMYVLGELQ